MFEDKRIPGILDRVQLLETEMKSVINKLPQVQANEEVLDEIDLVKASINGLIKEHRQLQAFIHSDPDLDRKYREFQAGRGL